MTKKRSVALITGGAKRLGRQICLTLAHNGFDIAIHYQRSEEAALQLADEIKQNTHSSIAKTFCADLTVSGERRQLTDAVYSEFGRVDLLVNNASIYKDTPADKFDAESLKPFMDIHLAAALDLSMLLAANLGANETPGRIVNISDVHASFSRKKYAPYLISKGAQDSLTRQLAIELAPQILVNGVAPGAILDPVGIDDATTRAAIVDRIPLGRFGTADDIAKTVLFLATSDYITGQIIKVDGGRSRSI